MVAYGPLMFGSCPLLNCPEPGPDAGNLAKPPKAEAPDLARGVAMKSINTFARHADKSRRWVYTQIKAGHLEAVRVGKRFVITADAERRFYEKVAAGQLAQAAE
jgi:hypothetical protein